MVTFPCNLLFSIDVFFDLETKFSCFTIQGLFISTIQQSASLPPDKLPLLIFKIFDGLEVNAAIIFSSFTDPLWYNSNDKDNNVSIPVAPVAAATGATGIETLLSLSLELYHNGSVKLEKIIAALTSNPSKILKINKGNLSGGNDADCCIVDINKPWIVKQENLVSKSKNTSIENKRLQGKVTNTFVKGQELYNI